MNMYLPSISIPFLSYLHLQMPPQCIKKKKKKHTIPATIHSSSMTPSQKQGGGGTGRGKKNT